MRFVVLACLINACGYPPSPKLPPELGGIYLGMKGQDFQRLRPAARDRTYVEDFVQKSTFTNWSKRDIDFSEVFPNSHSFGVAFYDFKSGRLTSVALAIGYTMESSPEILDRKAWQARKELAKTTVELWGQPHELGFYQTWDKYLNGYPYIIWRFEGAEARLLVPISREDARRYSILEVRYVGPFTSLERYNGIHVPAKLSQSEKRQFIQELEKSIGDVIKIPSEK